MIGIILRFTGIAGLLILVCGGLAWYKMSDLVAVLGRELLSGTDIELVSMTLARQSRLPLVIDELTLRSPRQTIQISNLRVSPLRPWENVWRLDLDQVVVTVNQSAQDLEAPASTVEDWRDQLTAALPALPEQGQIAHYRYCDDGCLSGRLHWQRQAPDLHLNLTVQQYGVHADLLISAEELALTVAADTTTQATAGITNPIPEALALALPARWTLDGRISTTDPSTVFITGEINLGSMTPTLPAEWLPADTTAKVALSQGHAEFSLAVPVATPATVTDLWRASTTALSIKADGQWRLSSGTTVLTSESTLLVSGVQNRLGASARLDKALQAKVSDENLILGLINVGAGVNCTLTEHLECTLASLSALGTLRAPPETDYNYDIELTDTRVTQGEMTWSAEGTARVAVSDATQPVLQTTASFTLLDNILLATSATAEVLGVALGNIVVRNDLLTGQGEAQVAFDAPLRDLEKLPQVAAIDTLQLSQGTIEGNIQVNWNRHAPTPLITRLASTIRLKNAAFDYDDYHFAGLFLDLQLAGWPVITSQQPARLRLQTLDVGIPITNITASLNLAMHSDTQQLNVQGQNLAAQLFGGKATAETFHFESSQLSGFAQVQLKALALQQILDLGRDDFESSGEISGSVPVQIKQGNINVVAGELAAVPPGGHIRYRPDQATRNLLMGSDKTKIVLDTLSDFQYHSLAVVLDYSPAGELTASTAIQGHNPQFESGREIHFNLSIEENIGTLLESLRMGDTVENKVQSASKLPAKIKY